MNSFIVLPLIYAAVGILQILLAKQPKLYSRLSPIVCCAVLLLYLFCCYYIPTNTLWQIHFIHYFGFNLNLAFIFDSLSRIMVLTIFIISSCIIRYSEYYLQSDQTQGRFLGQIYLVVASVLFLTLAGNLFTAFIAWQLIGITLYILLNHYHYNLAANRAAKKKFIINRIGDLCFLMAIVLVYHHLPFSLFSQLHVFNQSFLLPLLILIAVMTKSAQFPFQIWLPDTLETPTPVSALMHAGIINAGGFLLIRCAPMLDHNLKILALVMLVGFSSVVIGNIYLRRQTTIKKQLAYSTMAQMGYMVFQCGTGLFSAALFHLIAHGFFKGYLFLNSGNYLEISHRNVRKGAVLFRVAACSLFAFILIVIAYQFTHWLDFDLPILFLGFMAITLFQLTYRYSAYCQTPISLGYFVILCTVVMLAYLYALQTLTLYTQLDAFWINSITTQIILLAILFAVQLFFMLKKQSSGLKAENLKSLRFDIEKNYRQFLLTPLRQLGESVNRLLRQHKTKYIKWLVFVGMLLLSSVALCFNFYASLIAVNLKIAFSWLFIGIALLSMIIANRADKISGVIYWLLIFQISIFMLPLLHENKHLIILFFYYSINILLVLVTLYSILGNNKHTNYDHHLEQYNTLSWPLIYLSVCLLLLIGIPGTASFVGEIYFFNVLLSQSIGLFIVYAIAMLLLTIVLMHALQLHVFRLNHSTISHLRVTPTAHAVFVIMLVVNLFSGIFPQHTITWIAQWI